MQRNRPIIIAAVILGLLAIGLTLYSLRGGGQAAKPPAQAPVAAAPVIKKYIAKADIPPRTVLTAALVKEDDSPGDEPGAVHSMDDFTGKLTSGPIYIGQTIVNTMLTDPIKRTTPANFPIPVSTRAVAVMIDPGQTMGNIVDVGDRVDVIVVHKLKYKDPTSQENSEFRSGRTIAQNLLVLATDPAIKQVPAPAPASAAPPGQPGAPPPTPTPPPPPPPAPLPGQPIAKIRVVLAASPAEAERIAAAEEQGNIHLTICEPRAITAPVPEAFEYPVVIRRSQPARNNAPASNSGRSQSSGRSRDDLAALMAGQNAANSGPTQVPPANLPPANSNNLPIPTPAEPPTSEVTVIRGTEKTRVIVPQR